MNILTLIHRLSDLKKQAEQNTNAWAHVQTAYARGASLPGLLRIYGGLTDSKVDDRMDDAVLAALGELRQTVYNASEILRGTVAIAEGTARQLDGLVEFLDRATTGPLKNVLEGTGDDE